MEHSPEYISFLLVRLCHTYDQTMHILQKFVPLKPEKRNKKATLSMLEFIYHISNKEVNISVFFDLPTRRMTHDYIIMLFSQSNPRDG